MGNEWKSKAPLGPAHRYTDAAGKTPEDRQRDTARREAPTLCVCGRQRASVAGMNYCTGCQQLGSCVITQPSASAAPDWWQLISEWAHDHAIYTKDRPDMIEVSALQSLLDELLARHAAAPQPSAPQALDVAATIEQRARLHDALDALRTATLWVNGSWPTPSEQAAESWRRKARSGATGLGSILSRLPSEEER